VVYTATVRTWTARTPTTRGPGARYSVGAAPDKLLRMDAGTAAVLGAAIGVVGGGVISFVTGSLQRRGDRALRTLDIRAAAYSDVLATAETFRNEVAAAWIAGWPMPRVPELDTRHVWAPVQLLASDGVRKAYGEVSDAWVAWAKWRREVDQAREPEDHRERPYVERVGNAVDALAVSMRDDIVKA
jgi:hypothetical protein